MADLGPIWSFEACFRGQIILEASLAGKVGFAPSLGPEQLWYGSYQLVAHRLVQLDVLCLSSERRVVVEPAPAKLQTKPVTSYS